MQVYRKESMTSSIEIKFLGTGPSTGVPVIGCDCSVCQSDEPKNKRLRACIYLTSPEGNFLVDSGPDLRQQALTHQVRKVDAVFYTHGHVDHVAGFDDLRAFGWQRATPLPIYLNQSTLNILRNMYGWAFSADNTYRGYIRPAPHIFDAPLRFGQLTITPLAVEHGNIETHGLRFDHPKLCGGFAYIPDAKHIQPTSMQQLLDLDTLVIDALQHSPHRSHLTVAESLEIVNQLKPRQTYLTHLTHDIDYRSMHLELPGHVQLAYDGLTLTFP